MVAIESQKVGKKRPSRSWVREARRPPWKMNRAAINEQTRAMRRMLNR
jgi:hypothetical protein